MNVQVGKRYCWSPWTAGPDRWLNGVVASVDGKYAIVVDQYNREWQDLRPFKK